MTYNVFGGTLNLTQRWSGVQTMIVLCNVQLVTCDCCCRLNYELWTAGIFMGTNGKLIRKFDVHRNENDTRDKNGTTHGNRNQTYSLSIISGEWSWPYQRMLGPSERLCRLIIVGVLVPTLSSSLADHWLGKISQRGPRNRIFWVFAASGWSSGKEKSQVVEWIMKLYWWNCV